MDRIEEMSENNGRGETKLYEKRKRREEWKGEQMTEERRREEVRNGQPYRTHSTTQLSHIIKQGRAVSTSDGEKGVRGEGRGSSQRASCGAADGAPASLP